MEQTTYTRISEGNQGLTGEAGTFTFVGHYHGLSYCLKFYASGEPGSVVHVPSEMGIFIIYCVGWTALAFPHDRRSGNVNFHGIGWLSIER